MAAKADRDLLDLAHETATVVARRMSAGDCAFHCQLLASMFYEAVKGELKQTLPADARRVELLSAVVERCERAAHPGATPALISAQLRTALAMLEAHERPRAISAGGRYRGAPKLRLIQGGLSLASAH